MLIDAAEPLTRYLAGGRLPDRLLRRFVLWVAAVGIPATLLATRIMDNSWRLPLTANNLALELAGATILLAPALCAASAAWLTVRRLHDPAYQLLQLTAVSPRRLVWGHISAALLNLRGLLAVAVGLTPAVGAGMARLSRQWTARPYPFFSPFGLVYRQPWSNLRFVVWRIDRLGWLPEFYGWLIGTWGAILLGTVLGVWLALRWRKAVLAVPVAALLLLIAVAGPLIAIPWIYLERLPLPVRVLLAAVTALIPLLAGLALIRKAS